MRGPAPGELRLRQATLPRDAFFGDVEQVPAGQAVGRICAEMLTPYPPGIPAVLPGEVLDRAVVDTSGRCGRRNACSRCRRPHHRHHSCLPRAMSVPTD
ncbi:hypothetical protein [Streptomyces cyaneofuscatus]|uniref:Orn/Lys/Arg family decarboxylase n=1 Tax=Streptomyces cyaneofuscatus TaxID=66883 RepID=UPI003650B787